jgi:hypothetical protein
MSWYDFESEILIAASSGFMIDEVELTGIDGLTIRQVPLSSWMSWYDFDIDHPPSPILV